MMIIPIGFLPGMSGGGELFVVFLVVLLLFGAKRIPEVARGLARGLYEFRKASREVFDEIERAPGADRAAHDARAAANDVSGASDVPGAGSAGADDRPSPAG